MATTREALLAKIHEQIPDLRALRGRSFCEQHMQRDVSLPQLQFLLVVQEEGPRTVSELAHLLGMSMPSASAIIDRMDERGLLTRSRHSSDRRVVSVEITERGREVAEEFVGLKREQFQRILDTLTLTELSDVHTGLKALRTGIARVQSGSTNEDGSAARAS